MWEEDMIRFLAQPNVQLCGVSLRFAFSASMPYILRDPLSSVAPSKRWESLRNFLAAYTLNNNF